MPFARDHPEDSVSETAARSGDDIEEHARRKIQDKIEWAAAETRGPRRGPPADERADSDEPAVGARQAAENMENDPPA